MKYFSYCLLFIPLIIALILSGCANNNSADTRIFKDISVQEATDLIKNNQTNPQFIILDVRTPQEFSAGHIEGAFNLDFYDPSFKDELDKLDKGKTYFVYCRTGNRSGQTVKIMESMGFREAYNLSAGIVDWIASGQLVVK
jgi:rhodanese-related sulfurtransferase